MPYLSLGQALGHGEWIVPMLDPDGCEDSGIVTHLEGAGNTLLTL